MIILWLTVGSITVFYCFAFLNAAMVAMGDESSLRNDAYAAPLLWQALAWFAVLALNASYVSDCNRRQVEQTLGVRLFFAALFVAVTLAGIVLAVLFMDYLSRSIFDGLLWFIGF